MEEALANNETNVTKLNMEISSLKNQMACTMPNDNTLYSAQVSSAELEQQIDDLTKENQELKVQVNMLKGSLNNNDSMMTNMKDGLMERIQTLSTENIELREKYVIADKERIEYREKYSKYEGQINGIFDNNA